MTADIGAQMRSIRTTRHSICTHAVDYAPALRLPSGRRWARTQCSSRAPQ